MSTQPDEEQPELIEAAIDTLTYKQLQYIAKQLPKVKANSAQDVMKAAILACYESGRVAQGELQHLIREARDEVKSEPRAQGQPRRQNRSSPAKLPNQGWPEQSFSKIPSPEVESFTIEELKEQFIKRMLPDLKCSLNVGGMTELREDDERDLRALLDLIFYRGNEHKRPEPVRPPVSAGASQGKRKREEDVPAAVKAEEDSPGRSRRKRAMVKKEGSS
ncbi:hypothetical protein PsYK624_075450 [Phanerochaete sordida]|uniref:Uncharacterized protein n=1 Tax=Phanerochaete sordida TaxID=48140 RepID=A0A9P3GCK9_9APHY|nr:hypothetical protein PsYK624_075450 [Phanerochaete sordida]